MATSSAAAATVSLLVCPLIGKTPVAWAPGLQLRRWSAAPQPYWPGQELPGPQWIQTAAFLLQLHRGVVPSLPPAQTSQAVALVGWSLVMLTG